MTDSTEVRRWPIVRTGIGQDRHRFLPEDSTKYCIIGGVVFEGVPGLAAESDGDVVYHALCNAITSLTGEPIMGEVARELCRKDGLTDSQVYVEAALATLAPQEITHVAISIEAKRPKFQPRIEEMRSKLAEVLHIRPNQVGISAQSGDGLTDVACGEGVQATVVLTTMAAQ